MNVEGYVLDYINKIEEQGYDAYIVGKSVFLYMLGRPIEEYDIITSAPLFSLSKDQIESGNSVHILEHKKGIHISFFTSKESFYKNCCYKIDTLLYHHKHGLIDEKHGLDDLERKRITIFNPNVLSGNPLFLLEAIFYQAQYSFTLEKKLITYIASYQDKFQQAKKDELGKYFQAFLCLESPGKFFMKYKNIFSQFFQVDDFRMKVLDCTKNDLTFRLVALWEKEDIFLAEKFLREYGFSKPLRIKVLHILDCLELPLSKDNLKDFLSKIQKEDIGILFSLKRANQCALNQYSEIPILDDLEKECYSLWEKNRNVSIENLKIKEEDLENLGYLKTQISKVLDYLLILVQRKQIENSYDKLIDVASTLLEKNDEI